MPAIDVALFLLLSTITIVPIFYFDVLPLHDLPSHLARLSVIQSRGNDPVLSQYYALNWHLVPNLAIDIWAYVTTPLFDADMASRSFIALSFFLLTSGTIFLHRVLGGTGPWPFISFVFIWNEGLAWGFLSFLFSIGLALWLFGIWVLFRGYNIAVRTALHAVAAAALLICHLFGFAIYALAVGAYEAGNVVLKWRVDGIQMPRQEFFGGLLQFIPALVLFSLSQTASGASTFYFLGLFEKIASYSTPILLYSPLAQITVVGLFILALAYALRKKWAHITPQCWFIIITGALCSLAAPGMMFNSYFLSHRMPVALTFLFLATIQFVEFSRPIDRWFRTVLVVMVIAQTLFISWHWAGYQLVYQDMFAATRPVKQGDKILSMTVGSQRLSGNLRPPLERAVEFLVPTKKIFNPHIFADKWHQPMRLTVEAQTLKALAPDPIFSPDAWGIRRLDSAFETADFQGFDYVLTIRMDAHEDLIPKDWILRERVGLFRLYQPGGNEADQTK